MLAIERFQYVYNLNLKTLQIGNSHYLSTVSWGRDLDLSEFFEKIIKLKTDLPSYKNMFDNKDFYFIFEKL